VTVLSHRGRHAGSAHADNSLAAIGGALSAGFAGVEIDVRRTSDGAAALFHDRRTADGREVATLTRAELCRAAGHDVATLDEVVARFPGAFLDVELKSADALAAATPALLRADPARLLVTSFLHDVVAEAATRLEVPCGLLVAHRPATLDAAPWRPFAGHPAVRTVVVDADVCDAALVAASRADGFSVWAWGVVVEPGLALDGWIVDRQA
jgi:glycerophosphoryl diester phosphodiesterase